MRNLLPQSPCIRRMFQSNKGLGIGVVARGPAGRGVVWGGEIFRGGVRRRRSGVSNMTSWSDRNGCNLNAGEYIVMGIGSG